MLDPDYWTTWRPPKRLGPTLDLHNLLIVYRCIHTHSAHPPLWPGHSFPDSLLIVYQCTRTHYRILRVYRYSMSRRSLTICS